MTVEAMTACLVEHSSAIRLHLAALIDREGFFVPATFVTYEDALRDLPHHDPDLAIIENRLPDGSGIDLCRQLHEICPDVRLILHASTVSAADEREATEAGVSAIVLKSLDLGELFGTMRKLVREPRRNGGRFVETG